MAAILDMAKFTFDGELVQSVSEMVFDEVINAPEIGLFHTVFPDIVTTKEVGFIGSGGLVGKAHTGCDPVAQAWAVGTRKVTWTPKEWEILIHSCYSDLTSTAAVYSLKTGTAIGDFTNSDYMNVLTIVLAQAMKEFIIRLVWFSDEDAALVSGGGVITNGTDVGYFNLLDGFWKQMVTQYTSVPAQHVAITENAGSTYALQALSPANVRDVYLPGLVYQADMVLRAQTDGIIICTQSFYDGYAKSLVGLSIESLYTNLTEGQRTLTYDGKPLIAVPLWDSLIKAYENTGTKWHAPHRAVYTTKAVLGIGVDDPSSFGAIDVWYDRDTRKVKMEGMGKADAKLTNPSLFTIAI